MLYRKWNSHIILFPGSKVCDASFELVFLVVYAYLIIIISYILCFLWSKERSTEREAQ